ncbi:hypothetical protein NMG60_11032231 [Bertholletia excelsa]
MASSGALAPSSSSHPATYHVFLNFMVEEIGTRFADHLYTAFDQAGFRTFRGDKDLKIGENINSQLQEAIRESRASIILFSKGYASSIQCLDELVMILQHKNSCSAHHRVLPIFYDVDPSDVRKQMGSFEEAFMRHEERLETEEDERKREWKTKVEGWRLALTEVANLAGMNLQNQADGTTKKKWETQSWMIGMQETEEENDIMMLNYWKLGGDELTAGDELAISVDLGDIYHSIAKEIGVRLLYEEQQEVKSKQSTNEEKEEKTQQICTCGKVVDIDQCVPIDSTTKLYLPIHHENPKLKLTTNGGLAFTTTGLKFRYSGVIRDEKDVWMLGYYGHYLTWEGRTESKEVSSLESIFYGLKIIVERGWTGVEVELDSLGLLLLLDGTFEPCEKILMDDLKIDPEFIRYLLRRQKCTLSYTPFNQWNQVALQLVDMALHQQTGLVVLEHPPEELGLECLLEECPKFREETKDEHTQLQR